jgi:hypothetical protein
MRRIGLYPYDVVYVRAFAAYGCDLRAEQFARAHALAPRN